MNELLKTRLFGLLAEISQKVTNEEMQHAYEKLITSIDSIGNDNEFTNVIRMLNLTRIELQSLQTQFLYEQGKKCM